MHRHQHLRHFREKSGSGVPRGCFKIAMRVGDGGIPDFRNVVVDGGAGAHRPTEGGGPAAAGARHVPQCRRPQRGANQHQGRAFSVGSSEARWL